MNLKSTKIVLAPATCFSCWITPTSTTKTWGHNAVLSFWSMIFNHPGLCQHGCCKRRKPQYKRRTHYTGFSFFPPSQPSPPPATDECEEKDGQQKWFYNLM